LDFGRIRRTDDDDSTQAGKIDRRANPSGATRAAPERRARSEPIGGKVGAIDELRQENDTPLPIVRYDEIIGQETCGEASRNAWRSRNTTVCVQYSRRNSAPSRSNEISVSAVAATIRTRALSNAGLYDDDIEARRAKAAT